MENSVDVADKKGPLSTHDWAWGCVSSFSTLVPFVGFESRPKAMSRGHVRPWPQPRALFRPAWCVALSFCAFTPWCMALYSKSRIWRQGGKRDTERQYLCKNCQSNKFWLGCLGPLVLCLVLEEELGSGEQMNDAPCGKML